MAPPQATANHEPRSLQKDLTHRVRSGAVQKRPSPPVRSPTMATALQTQLASQLTPNQKMTMQPPSIPLTTTSAPPTVGNGPMVQVIVHNPTNRNDTIARPAPMNILRRSPVFQQRLQALASKDVPVLHVDAEIEYYDIVANWLFTNNVLSSEGSLPNFHTLSNVIFVADMLQLSQLITQIINMMRLRQFATSAVPPPPYSEVYRRTSPGNPFRRFTAELYIASNMGVNQSCVPLEDLAASMLVEIIRLREGYWKRFTQKILDEQLTKAKEALEIEYQTKLKDKEAELAKLYEERLAKAAEVIVRRGSTSPVMGDTSPVTHAPLQAAAPSPEGIGSVLLDELKKVHEKVMEDTKKKNDERYNQLVEVMKQRNLEHLEAVQIMEKATEAKEARLMQELHELRQFKQESIMATQATQGDQSKTIEDLRSIIKAKEEAEDAILRENAALKKDKEKVRAISNPPSETHNIPLLVKNIEQLNKTIDLLKTTNEDLQKANDQLEQAASTHLDNLTKLNQNHADTEERNTRQIALLRKRFDEQQKEIEGLEARMKEKNGPSKDEVARLAKSNMMLTYELRDRNEEVSRLKKANKRLMEQLDDGGE